MKIAKKSFFIPPVDSNPELVARYEVSSPWPNEDIGFNILNYSYPVMHTHEYYEVNVVLSGECLHKVNGVSYTMRAGDCCLIRPDDRHCLEALTEEGKAPYLSVNFMCQREYFGQLIRIFGEDCGQIVLEEEYPLGVSVSNALISEIERTCLYIQSPDGSPSKTDIMLCRALFSELVSQCIQAHFLKINYNYPEWLQDFILYLQDPDTFSKNVDEMIVSIPYSYSYIQKQFKKYLGVSIISYVNSLKVSCAKELLISTQMSIAELASYLGYDSVAHLNHLFKSSVGVSPMVFRKQNSSKG